MKKIFVLMIALLFLQASAVAQGAEEPDGTDEAETDSGDVMGDVYIEGEFLDGDILKISIMAEEMLAPVLGTAFNLKYDDSLAFLKYEPGEFFERGGDPFYMVQNDEDSGKIIFGETLRRDDDFPIGSGKIVDMYFQILEEKEFKFVFERGVVSTLDIVRQDLNEILWDDVILKRGDGSEVIYSSLDGGANVLGSRTGGLPSYAIPLFIILAAAGVGFGAVVFLKKQENKRAKQYVNFK
ncbi:MAG: hypothetical protein ABIH78_03705 [Candidatus Peregrinibacteria bacterium]